MAWAYPKQLTDEQLEKLTTHRLLNLHRSIRLSAKRIYMNLCDEYEQVIFSGSFYEECITCHKVWKKYQARIKAVLDKREHVSREKHVEARRFGARNRVQGKLVKS